LKKKSKKKVGKRSIGFVYYSFVSSLYTQRERPPFQTSLRVWCLCAVSVFVCRERAVARVIFPAWSCRIFLPLPHHNPQTTMKSLTAFVCFVVLPGELSSRFLAAKRRRIQFHSSISFFFLVLANLSSSSPSPILPFCLILVRLFLMHQCPVVKWAFDRRTHPIVENLKDEQLKMEQWITENGRICVLHDEQRITAIFVL
jgi:hypothetical protein